MGEGWAGWDAIFVFTKRLRNCKEPIQLECGAEGDREKEGEGGEKAVLSGRTNKRQGEQSCTINCCCRRGWPAVALVAVGRRSGLDGWVQSLVIFESGRRERERRETFVQFRSRLRARPHPIPTPLQSAFFSAWHGMAWQMAPRYLS